MVRKAFVLIATLLSATVIAFPQGRGGGQGGGNQQRSMQGGAQSGHGGMQTGTGQGQMDRDRIRLNNQQRDQIRTCDRLADGVRKQARTMAKSSGNKADKGQLLQERDQLRDQVRAMEQEHVRLMNNMDPTQQRQWQERLNAMNQYRDQVHNQLQQIDDTFQSADPDFKGAAKRAREMERIVSRWQKEYDGLLE
jgi:hypothetical protein